MSPLLSIGAVFVLMLAGIRLKLGLGLSILAGSLLLALFFDLSLFGWIAAIPDALINEEALILCLIIAVILAFSAVYTASGQSEAFMRAIRTQIRSRSLLLVFFPALIGLLPMPGGAIFSAPMVETAAQELQVSPKDQAFINYWFRHLWELAWPLYPGVILASALGGIPVTSIVALMWPGPLVSMFLGWLLILRPALRHAPDLAAIPAAQRKSKDWLGAIPLAAAICGSIVGEMCCAALFPGRPMEYGIIVAMLVATGISLVLARANWRAVVQAARRDNTMTLLGVVAAIFIFKEILSKGHVVDALALSLGGGGALIFMAVALPYLVGFVSGITIAFVGATFPLLFGLLHSLGQAQLIPAYLCLGLYSGFAGIMSSPMHICYLMTCNYFHQDPGKLLPRILVSGLLFIPFGLAFFVLQQP